MRLVRNPQSDWPKAHNPPVVGLGNLNLLVGTLRQRFHMRNTEDTGYLSLTRYRVSFGRTQAAARLAYPHGIPLRKHNPSSRGSFEIRCGYRSPVDPQ